MTAKIAYLMGAYPRWSETFLRQDLALLLELGLPLLPLCLFPGDVPVQPAWPSVTCLGADARVETSPIPPPRSGLLGRLPPKLRSRLSLLAHRRLLRRLDAVVAQENVTHVHAEFADLPALLAAHVSRRRGMTFSVGVHARDVHVCKFDPVTVFAGASFITACNRAAQRRLEALFPPAAARTHWIPHGLVLEQWTFAERRPAPTARLEALFIGRLVPKKGVDDLLRALQMARQRDAELTLTVVGTGPEQPALQALADSLGVADRVTWLGVVPRDRVPELLASADCLVVPSVVAPDGDQDGVPNVMLEAMAAGTPVVGTSVGGLGEVLTDSTGWDCRPGSPHDLLEAILLSRTDGAAETKRRNARKVIETKFDARKLAGQRAELLLRELQGRATQLI